MPDPLAEMLREDPECEGLLECFHGLSDLDRACFRTLADSGGPRTVDELADEVDRERSTVYRSVKRLEEAGFVDREQRNYEDGGYYHVYHAADPDEIANDLQRLLNDWYAKMGQLIQEFRDSYAGRVEAARGDGDSGTDADTGLRSDDGTAPGSDPGEAPSTR